MRNALILAITGDSIRQKKRKAREQAAGFFLVNM